MARGERCVLWDKVALGAYNANNINNAIHNGTFKAVVEGRNRGVLREPRAARAARETRSRYFSTMRENIELASAAGLW